MAQLSHSGPSFLIPQWPSSIPEHDPATSPAAGIVLFPCVTQRRGLLPAQLLWPNFSLTWCLPDTMTWVKPLPRITRVCNPSSASYARRLCYTEPGSGPARARMSCPAKAPLGSPRAQPAASRAHVELQAKLNLKLILSIPNKL
jgi:hypothetical protein